MKIARQSGKTTIFAITAIWCALFTSDYSIGVFSNKSDSAKNILNMIKDMYDNLPNWLKIGVITWSSMTVEFSNKSKIKCHATTADAGRSSTYQFIILDEFAFIEKNLADEFMGSVTPTVSSAGRNGHILCASTPKGLNKFFEMWRDSENPNSGYYRIEANWKDTGKTEEFKAQEIAAYGLMKWNQEYECQFLGSDITLLNLEALEKLNKDIDIGIRKTYNCKAAPKDFKIQKYWDHPCYKRARAEMIRDGLKYKYQYTIGIDGSEGIGQNYSVAQVLRMTPDGTKYKLVAQLRCNSCLPSEFALWCWEMSDYFNKASFRIETQSTGGIIIQEIMNIAKERECYKWDPEQKINVVDHRIKQFDKKRIGIFASEDSKKAALIRLKDLVERDKMSIPDEQTVEELRRFTKYKNSFKASYGLDDCVMALAWACYKFDLENDPTSDVIAPLKPINPYENFNPFRNGKRWIIF